MEEKVEYETPISCLRRLTQKDNSDDFDFIVKFTNEDSKENNVRTSLNKARAISNKVNSIYQIDPTITKYELIIPKAVINTIPQNESDNQIKTILSNLEMILKSTTETITISQPQKEQINLLLRLLGERNEHEELIKINSINEAISYLSTEFHSESVKYLSTNIIKVIDECQLFDLNEDIINEIIESYFAQAEKNNDQEEISAKLKKSDDVGLVMHFLLRIDASEYTSEMREYVIEHLSDEVVNKELSQIIIQFINQVSRVKAQKVTKSSQKFENVKFESDELKGIISRLKEKCGDDIIGKGEIKLSDVGSHHHPGGSLSNLIMYDESRINNYYINNRGLDPLPNSSEGWIEFDFIKRKINIDSYTIRSGGNYYPKSWRIVGSNDRNEWEVVNQQNDNSSLNGDYTQHRFVCENEHKYYRYIRYIQDDSWSSNRKHNVYLTCVEFFGSISISSD